MEVKECEMYHFHNNKVYNDIWYINNEIIVDDNFESYYLNVLKFFNTSVKLNDGSREAFNYVIDGYLDRTTDLDTLIKLLKEARRIIYGTNIFKRELALEEVRKTLYPNLPSRKHSIWLCDEEGLDFWEEEISNHGEIKLDLYKVSVTGVLFKSSDSFIPNNPSDYETNLDEALRYWDPHFKNAKDYKKAEYLFQGKVKILDKIN